MSNIGMSMSNSVTHFEPGIYKVNQLRNVGSAADVETDLVHHFRSYFWIRHGRINSSRNFHQFF